MKKENSVLFAILTLLLFLPITSALVSFEPLLPVYNVGDDFDVRFSITKTAKSHDFLSAQLVCDNESVELYKSPISLKASEQKIIEIPTQLDSFIINSMRGVCTVDVIYKNETEKSQEFEISDEALVNAKLEKLSILPGNEVKITGTATKKNAQPLEGIVEITIKDLNLKTGLSITDGTFNTTLNLPSDANAQSYEIKVTAQEKDGDEVLNSGETTTYFKVPQVATKQEIALSIIEVNPGDNVTYTPLVYDQSDKTVSTNSNVTITDPDGSTILAKLLKTEDKYLLQTNSETKPGSWSITATHGSLKITKNFNVRELRSISTILEDNILKVTNTGNIPYQGSVEVNIGETPKNIALDLGLGESHDYNLFAPEGAYPIELDDGETTHDLGSVFLTGKAIEIRDADKFSFDVSPSFFWILGIIVLLTIIVTLYRKRKQRVYWGDSPSRSGKTITTRALTPVAREGGKKQDCAVLSLYLKDFQKLKSQEDNSIHSNIDRIIEDMRLKNAAIYNQGPHKIAVFSSSSGSDAATNALNAAKEIENSLVAHNTEHAQHISFGIGINKGQMIAEVRNGSRVFTAVGTTVLTAKRLAEHAKNHTLISEDIRKMIVGKARTEKAGNKSWRFKGFSKANAGSSDNSKFLKKFTERNS